MKKILCVTTMLLSTLIFISALNYHSFENLLSVSGLRLMDSNPDLYFMSANIEFDDKFELDDILEKMVDTVSNQKTEIVINHEALNKNMIPVNSRYLYKNNTNYILHYLNLELDNKYIDFTTKKNYYYSDDLNDRDSYNYISYINIFDRLNSSKDVNRYYPLKSISSNIDVIEEGSVFVYLYTYMPDKILNDLLNKKVIDNITFSDFKSSILSVQDLVIPTVDNSQYFTLISVISFLSLILLLIQTIYKKVHNIGIHKLMGVTKRNITNGLFLKTLIVNLFIYILVQFILFFLLCGIINRDSILFIKDLIKYYLYIILLFTCIYVVAYFMVGKVKATDAIKRRQTKNVSFYFLSLLVKAFMIIFAATSFIDISSMTFNDSKSLYTLISRRSNMNQYYQLYRIKTSDPFEFMDLSKEILEFGEKYKLRFLDVEEQKNYFNDSIYLLAKVNRNYLNEYDLYDQYNKKINTNNKENVTYVPIKFKKNENKINQEYGIRTKVVYYYNDIKMYSDNYPTIATYIKNPIILKIADYSSIDDICSISLTSNSTTIGVNDLNDFMENYRKNFDTKISFTKVEDILNTYLPGMIVTFVKNFLIVLLFMYFYYHIVKHCITVYLREFGHKISIRYLHGWRFYQRYKEFYILNVGGYFLSFILLTVVRHLEFNISMQYVGLFFIFDMTLSLLYLVKNQAKLIKNNLKGGTLE